MFSPTDVVSDCGPFGLPLLEPELGELAALGDGWIDFLFHDCGPRFASDFYFAPVIVDSVGYLRFRAIFVLDRLGRREGGGVGFAFGDVVGPICATVDVLVITCLAPKSWLCQDAAIDLLCDLRHDSVCVLLVVLMPLLQDRDLASIESWKWCEQAKWMTSEMLPLLM